jgi:hypothetical protein
VEKALPGLYSGQKMWGAICCLQGANVPNHRPAEKSDADQSCQRWYERIVQVTNGMILGGEVMGGRSVGELTNVIGLAIQNGITANNLLVAQICTHPMLPLLQPEYPLIKAAEAVAKKTGRIAVRQQESPWPWLALLQTTVKQICAGLIKMAAPIKRGAIF